MKYILFFRFNIRQKIVIGLTVMSLAVGALAAVSYFNLLAMEKKVYLVEFADDLSHFVLEVRRSEKNLLLYGHEEDRKENIKYTSLTRKMLEEAFVDIKDEKILNKLEEIDKSLGIYSRLLGMVPGSENHPDYVNAVATLRETGKKLLDQTSSLAKLERAEIVAITKNLRYNLFFSILILAILAVLLIFFVSFKILAPLKVIEQTTARIADGDFSPLPIWNSNDEIEQLMDAFNRMVTELEKRQDQLVQAKKLSSIGTLASGIAHQLNNPLNNISTSCQILMEEENPEPEFENRMLMNIEQETMRARDIVRGLLEFSRHREFSLAESSLSSVVDSSVRLVSSHVPPAIEITSDVPSKIWVLMDTQRMQECLINLLLNAIQAITDSVGKVMLYVEPAKVKDKIILVVEDTGQGISKEDQARIFDPFFTTKDVGAGTGLGLYVAYGIIKKFGGQIWVESSVGNGTRFLIELPCTRSCSEGADHE